MAFELLKKQNWKSGIGDNEVSFSKSTLRFGIGFANFLSRHRYCEVYLDKENNKIGFKPCDNSITGFKIQTDKASPKKLSLNNNKIVDFTPLGRYMGKIEEDMLVVGFDKISKQETQVNTDNTQ
jgi:hypothetical protein